MKIAIPVYKNSVSNTFDFARKLLVVTVEEGSETQRSEVEIAGREPAQRAARVKGLGVDVIICGAVSHFLAGMIEKTGIELIPYVTGNVEEVLQAYLSGELMGPRFRMPGCRHGLRKGRRMRFRLSRPSTVNGSFPIRVSARWCMPGWALPKRTASSS